jgi:hypothetical protein
LVVGCQEIQGVGIENEREQRPGCLAFQQGFEQSAQSKGCFAVSAQSGTYGHCGETGEIDERTPAGLRAFVDLQNGFRHGYLQNVATTPWDVHGDFSYSTAKRGTSGKHCSADHTFVTGDEEKMPERTFVSVGGAWFPLAGEPLVRDDFRIACVHVAKIRILSRFAALWRGEID